MAGTGSQEWGIDGIQASTFMRLDVHRTTISVAIAQCECGGESRHWEPVHNRVDHICKFVEKLATGGARLYFCGAAGLCGYGLHLHLVDMAPGCFVVAPSLIPVQGYRVKTDRRNAVMLAELHRAGHRTAV